jgi:hypothetical protein
LFLSVKRHDATGATPGKMGDEYWTNLAAAKMQRSRSIAFLCCFALHPIAFMQIELNLLLMPLSRVLCVEKGIGA